MRKMGCGRWGVDYGKWNLEVGGVGERFGAAIGSGV